MKVSKLFDQCAALYDKDRRKLVPFFDEFYGSAIHAIPFPASTNIRVLDLGSGTGLFAAMIAQAFPAASLHLTDISEAMLEQARKRFANNPHVTYATQEHLQLSATSEYDLIISALSIHHLEHSNKQSLFPKIFNALSPGGVFINADQALAPNPPGEEVYEKQWIEDVIANGVSREALEAAQKRMREDKNALLIDQLRWLSGSGFCNVDCWYRRFRFVVYGGTKNGSNQSIHADGNSAALHSRR